MNPLALDLLSVIVKSLSSCGSVVEHCVSSTKVVGSILGEHMY